MRRQKHGETNMVEGQDRRTLVEELLSQESLVADVDVQELKQELLQARKTAEEYGELAEKYRLDLVFERAEAKALDSLWRELRESIPVAAWYRGATGIMVFCFLTLGFWKLCDLVYAATKLIP